MSATRLTAAALIASLAACAVGPDFKRPTPPAATDYGNASSAPTAAVDAATNANDAGSEAQRFVAGMDIPNQWWTLFRSAKLNRLVEQALEGNPNVGAAQAALRQAHELYLAQRTSFFPSVQGNFDGTRSEFPTNTLTSPTVAPSSSYTLYTAQLTLSYAPDIFGATRRQVEIARAQADSARFQLEAAYLTLSSNVVVTAIQEASLRGQILSTERSLQLEHQLTEFVRQQRLLGTASDLDVLEI